MKLEGVKSVTDLHVWALGGNKNILTAHITIENPADNEI
jgi:Co/Zn/Cd efflux system component